MNVVILTGRIAEAVGLLMAGLKPKEIAVAMGIEKRTVKQHLQHAFNRAGITRRWVKRVRLVYLVSIGAVTLRR